jgi:hypothetical protein
MVRDVLGVELPFYRVGRSMEGGGGYRQEMLAVNGGNDARV